MHYIGAFMEDYTNALYAVLKTFQLLKAVVSVNIERKCTPNTVMIYKSAQALQRKNQAQTIPVSDGHLGDVACVKCHNLICGQPHINNISTTLPGSVLW